MFDDIFESMSVPALERLVCELQIANDRAAKEVQFTRERDAPAQSAAAQALWDMSRIIEKVIYDKEHS